MTIYLYHKHCSHCGLKYFGRPVKDDPYKYTGSGVHWKRHIKKYGEKNVITDWIKAFDNQEECTKFALAFSHDNNIVESTDWANVIVEDGKHRNDMSGFKHSVETKSQISESQKGRVGERRRGEKREEEKRREDKRVEEKRRWGREEKRGEEKRA